MVDLEQFTPKSKPVIYTGALIELYNWGNCGQDHEIHRIIEFKKMRASITKNPRNFGACRIIKIFLVLRSTYVISRDQDKVVFYVHNYIDWD